MRISIFAIACIAAMASARKERLLSSEDPLERDGRELRRSRSRNDRNGGNSQ